MYCYKSISRPIQCNQNQPLLQFNMGKVGFGCHFAEKPEPNSFLIKRQKCREVKKTTLHKFMLLLANPATFTAWNSLSHVQQCIMQSVHKKMHFFNTECFSRAPFCLGS